MSMSNAKHERLATSLRSYLRSLSFRRATGTVTADDAHVFLNKQGVARSVNTRLSLINAALSTGFDAVGTVPSNRPAARGRQITEWTVA